MMANDVSMARETGPAYIYLFSDGWKTQSSGLWQSVGATLTLIILPPDRREGQSIKKLCC